MLKTLYVAKKTNMKKDLYIEDVWTISITFIRNNWLGFKVHEIMNSLFVSMGPIK